MRIFTRTVKVGLLTSAMAILLTSCGNSDIKSPSNENLATSNADRLPPIADYLACLPQETALLAAHRGSARNSKYPENSLSALKALLDKGYLLTEIDVARLKDGVHILYHDGVWDEKSTGKGSLAATTWKEAQKLLLMDTKGNFSADSPVKLDDYLKAAKGQIYVEVDFKSSSKYETVIKKIRANDMADQVILISYSDGQTRKLSRLAPDMMLSVSTREALGQTRFKTGQLAAWVGYDLDDIAVIRNLEDKDIPIIGRVRKNWGLKDAKSADILVTDNIFNHEPIAGLNEKNKEALNNCLAAL